MSNVINLEVHYHMTPEQLLDNAIEELEDLSGILGDQPENAIVEHVLSNLCEISNQLFADSDKGKPA